MPPVDHYEIKTGFMINGHIKELYVVRTVSSMEEAYNYVNKILKWPYREDKFGQLTSNVYGHDKNGKFRSFWINAVYILP